MTAFEDHNEKLLVELLVKGDQVAFEKLYNIYSGRLLGHILKMVKIESIACELLQVVFIKLWTHHNQLDSNLSFRSYLFRIAETTVYDFFRKAARDKQLQKQLIDTACSHYNHVEESTFAKEDIRLLNAAMDSLPPQRRQVFRLVKMEGKSYAEVSRELNISTSTVSDHVVKATKFIKQHLQKKNSIAISLLLLFVLQN